MAISYNSSFWKLSKLITWNLERNFFPNSCLLFANKPLFGFWVAIKLKPLPIGISFQGIPGISQLILWLSKHSSKACNTWFDARLISSNNNVYPFLKASINAPSWKSIPEKESGSPTYLPNKSDVFVSELRLNLLNLSPISSHNISTDFVLAVPVGPSNKTG